MDWDLVVAKLRWFGQNSIESANAILRDPNFYPPKDGDAIRRHREQADLLMTLAAALEAGLKK